MLYKFHKFIIITNLLIIEGKTLKSAQFTRIEYRHLMSWVGYRLRKNAMSEMAFKSIPQAFVL